VFVYDVTNPKSLENIERWKEEYYDAQPKVEDRTVFAVFGNKVPNLYWRYCLLALIQFLMFAVRHGRQARDYAEAGGRVVPRPR
jgi:GTPase SAR1 family protein